MSQNLQVETSTVKNKTVKVPHTYVIIFMVVLLAWLLTFLVPVGKFETQEVKYKQGEKEKKKTVVKADSFQYEVDESGNVVRKPAKLWGTEDTGGYGMLNYVFEGLVTGNKWGSAVGIVAFILVIGGAFGIILRTGAVDSGIMSMIKVTKGKEFLIIPVLFVLFSLGGAIFGMGEETIPFAMIVVPLVIALGYDAVVGVLITYVASQIGFATSWMNPFSLAVAQGVSGVPVFSGATFRIIMWIVFTFAGLVYTMVYASKVKRNPEYSVSKEANEYFKKEAIKEDGKHEFNLGHKLVLLTILLGIIWVVWGVTKKAYYIPEIASQFFVMGLVAGIIGVIFKLNDMKVDDIATSFQRGAADLVGAALVVGMAKGILIILGGSDPSTPTVLNTILNGMGKTVGQLGGAFAAWFMYLFQSIFNFFVVSGSGQAALTMPIMAPLSDLVGVSRQTAVLAFQLGDGLTNVIVPTSACLMGVLGVARIDWGKWAKWQIKMQGFLFLLGTIFVLIAHFIGF
ncbi:putative basic amino acid antiporter YfcC [Caloramator proteoclasticus]|uniref:Uncharacterized membrane protein YfcC, ion transporter superfamily n=1 Tax=Caloramator proteoclasticus DSM 10124 TaxID=1121262 RepID=A0A1M4XN47_9CLOT|nr:putative basic amino acid antiporter YfcC [Caloramator proteoclasticus]SHE95024.1 Uncharacterized membrane protein YfcC, ion transporter superfamily [Caloramator proteoclasticus DSM 10124]